MRLYVCVCLSAFVRIPCGELLVRACVCTCVCLCAFVRIPCNESKVCTCVCVSVCLGTCMQAAVLVWGYAAHSCQYKISIRHG